MSEVHRFLASQLLSGRGGMLPTVEEQEEIERLHKSGIPVADAALVATVGEVQNKELLSLFNIQFSDESGRDSADS